MKTEPRNYRVLLTFQFPAWDEKAGIEYVVTGKSKADAIKSARRQAERDGHAVSGRGKYWFKAEETDETPASDEIEDLFK